MRLGTALSVVGIAGTYAVGTTITRAGGLTETPFWLYAAVSVAIGLGMVLTPAAARRRASRRKVRE